MGSASVQMLNVAYLGTSGALRTLSVTLSWAYSAIAIPAISKEIFR